MRDVPKYKKNLFCSDKKHITRTINTYISYKKVNQIYLTFNHKHNKYELFLSIDGEEIAIDNKDNFILVYERYKAVSRKADTDFLLSVLNDYDVKSNWKESTLKNLKQLILAFHNNKTNQNKFFLENSNKVIYEIKKFIGENGTYKQIPSEKLVSKQDMIAKRLYSTIFNKVHYEKGVLNKISSLQSKKVEFEKKSLEATLEELSSFVNSHYDNRINEIELFEYNKVDTNLTYKDIICAIELFDSYGSEIAPGYDMKTLLQEKMIYEDNINISIKEDIHKQNLFSSIEYEIKKHFKYYLKVQNDFIANNKKFTKSEVTRYINNFILRYEQYTKSRKWRRKEKIKQMEEDFGKDYKAFFKMISSFNNQETRSFVNSIVILHDYKHLLNVFNNNENEVNNIFNGLYKNDSISDMRTLYEKKLEDGYFELKKYWERLQENLNYLIEDERSYPPEEFEEEYNILVQQMEDTDIESRTIYKKYKNTPIHPFAQNYLDEQEKSQDSKNEEEYNPYQEAQNEYPKYEDFYSDTDVIVDDEDENHPPSF